MTGAEPARRLLARLVDEQAIETEPIAEIRADLAALGIDPARAIALSRRLANANSPAASLLRRISASEEDDDEIRRLEQADIRAVRRELPEGVTAATSARAHGAAGGESNIVGIRRRRSRRLLYGLSGVAAAMAASLVLYVGMSTNQSFRFAPPREASETTAVPTSTPPSSEKESRDLESVRLADQPVSRPRSPEAEKAPSDETSVVAQHQLSGENLQAANQPAASGMQSAPAPQPGAPAVPMAEADPLLMTPRADQQLSAADTAGARNERAASAVEEPKNLEAIGRRDQPLDLAARYGGAGSAATAEPPPAPLGLAHAVAALLIVDPRLVPAGMQQKDYPVGALPARLEDARRLAGGRPIAALVTMQVDDRMVDAIVLARPPTTRTKTVPSAVPLGPVLPGYELIEFDRR